MLAALRQSVSVSGPCFTLLRLAAPDISLKTDSEQQYGYFCSLNNDGKLHVEINSTWVGTLASKYTTYPEFNSEQATAVKRGHDRDIYQACCQ